MGIETSQFARRHQKALKRHAGSLGELYDKICPVDAGLVGEDGTCATCGRQIKEATQDFVQPPDMSDQQAEAQRQFWARRERQLRERDQEAAAAAKKNTPVEREGRDYSRAFDSTGNVRSS